MDPDIIKNLAAELTDNPMFLLDIPESIFELFEVEKEEEMEDDQPTGNQCYSGFKITES